LVITGVVSMKNSSTAPPASATLNARSQCHRGSRAARRASSWWAGE
jgi:hypothetical protein